MSNQTDSGHPSPEELDLLLDDAADSDGTHGRLAEHVAACARCRQVLAGMSTVRTLLRAERDRVPPPPADLGDRIAAALAAERSAAAQPQQPAGASAATVVPLRRRSVVPRWLAAVAGLVVLGGAALTATQLMDGEPDQAAMFGADAAQESQESAAGAGGGSAPLAAVVATGTDYEPDRLEEQVRALLAGQRGLPAAEALAAPGGADDEPLATPEGVSGCLEALGADPGAEAVVDLASWQGQAVGVVVLDGQDRHTVWVVERGCRPGADGLVHYQVVPD